MRFSSSRCLTRSSSTLPTDQRSEWNRKRRGAGCCGDRFGGRRRDPVEARVLLQNGVLEPAQTWARFESKLFVQRRPCPFIGAERVGLAPAPVQRNYQLLVEPLSQRVLIDDPAQIPHNFAMASELEKKIVASFDRCPTRLVESRDLAGGEGLAVHIGQSISPPQGERLVQLCQCAIKRVARSADTCRLRRADEPLEAVDIDLVG